MKLSLPLRLEEDPPSSTSRTRRRPALLWRPWLALEHFAASGRDAFDEGGAFASALRSQQLLWMQKAFIFSKAFFVSFLFVLDFLLLPIASCPDFLFA